MFGEYLDDLLQTLYHIKCSREEVYKIIDKLLSINDDDNTAEAISGWIEKWNTIGIEEKELLNNYLNIKK